ncbi:hypothetical protein FKM82_020270 [Ascaphus truei]
MEKQMQGGIENNGSTASVQPCSADAHERDSEHFSMPGNSCSLSEDLGLRISIEHNGTGIPKLAGSCGDLKFAVHRPHCYQGLKVGNCEPTQDLFRNAGELWTEEFLSEASVEDFVTESSENADNKAMPETAGCIGRESPTPTLSDCGCTRETIDLSGGTYSDIADHSCSRGCHHFSSYQQRPLDGEGGEDGDCGRRVEVEEDSCKGTGGRKSGRRGKNRISTREEARRDGRQPPSSGGKHKSGRKKSHVEGRRQLRSMVPQPLVQLSTSCVQLLIDLVLLIGEYVETLGTFLYFKLWLPARDLGHLKIQLWTFGQWSRQLAKDAWIKTCSFGLWLLRVLKMLCALLFLLFMLSVGCARLCWQYIKRAVVRVGGDSKWASQISLALQRIWALVAHNRTCSRLVSQLRRWTTWLWPSKLRTDKEASWTSTGPPSTGTGRYQPGEEVERLLTMACIPEEELNPFQVLGVEMNASDTELKKAYRQLAVLVHPDKNNHPRAEEAFKVLRAAWDTVSNPEKRKEYEM